MAWLDDRIRDHPKVRNTTGNAFKWWAFCLCYCSAHGTNGQLNDAIKALKVPRRYVQELVEIGLWDDDTDGLWIHDWQEHNQKRDDALEERRKQDRERQRAHRDKVRRSRDRNVTSRDTQSRDSHATLSRDTDRDGPRGRAPAPPRDHDQDINPRAVTEPQDDEPDLHPNGQPPDRISTAITKSLATTKTPT